MESRVLSTEQRRIAVLERAGLEMQRFQAMLLKEMGIDEPNHFNTVHNLWDTAKRFAEMALEREECEAKLTE